MTVPVTSRTCAPASGVNVSWWPGGPGPGGQPTVAAGRTAATAAAAVAGGGLAAAEGGEATAAAAGAGEGSVAASGRAVQGCCRESLCQSGDLQG